MVLAQGNSLMQKYGRSIMRLGWWEVHKILAGAQPEGSVIFNSKFSECVCSSAQVLPVVRLGLSIIRHSNLYTAA